MIKLLLTKTNKIDLIINLISYIRIKFYYQKTNLLYINYSDNKNADLNNNLFIYKLINLSFENYISLHILFFYL